MPEDRPGNLSAHDTDCDSCHAFRCTCAYPSFAVFLVQQIITYLALSTWGAAVRRGRLKHQS
jgi:hypothetical protein